MNIFPFLSKENRQHTVNRAFLITGLVTTIIFLSAFIYRHSYRSRKKILRKIVNILSHQFQNVLSLRRTFEYSQVNVLLKNTHSIWSHEVL